jgi:cytochrome c biogenesis protein CcmG/thiol:disulfide interchange protein DsbE
MQKYIPFLVLFFLVGLIGVSTYKLNQKQEIAEDLPTAANPDAFNIHFVKTNIELPEFSLPDLFDDKENFSKEDLMGKYSIINFFASWCTTCRAEHDVLLRLRDAKIANIYGIAWRDIDDNTKKFLQESGNPFTKIAKDNAGLFTRITGIEAVPETLIVDPKGKVVMRYRGNLQDFSIEEIQRFLNRNGQ